MSDRHFSIPMPDGSRAMLDCFGDDEFEIETSKGIIRFEWSDRFAPMPVTKTGAQRNLAPRHPFWRAVSLWILQGRRIENGRAFWHEPRKPKYDHIGGRHYLAIEDGEVGHDW
jgi:hypothetical protein